jgi:hypothetical protein
LAELAAARQQANCRAQISETVGVTLRLRWRDIQRRSALGDFLALR